MSKINDLVPSDEWQTEIALPALPEHDLLVDCAQGFVEGYTATLVREYARAAIAAFLERTGQYVTNDASREAAIAEATTELRAERDELQRLLTEARGPEGEEREEAFAEWLRGRGWACTPPTSSPPRKERPETF